MVVMQVPQFSPAVRHQRTWHGHAQLIGHCGRAAAEAHAGPVKPFRLGPERGGLKIGSQNRTPPLPESDKTDPLKLT